MKSKHWSQRVSPVAAGVLILGCAAFALTVLALHQSSRFALPPSPSPSHAAPSLTLTPPPASAPAAAGPRLVWSDEFDGPAGQPPAESKWNHDVGGGGWGNGEWEYYTASTRNAALDGTGNLVITARRPDQPAGICAVGPCDITSARLQTDGTFSAKYGRVEARLQAPAGRGLWSAFWMIAADDSAELDIMEQNGRDPGLISGTAHIYKYTPAGGIGREFRLPPTAPANTFHVYAIDWSPSQIVWSVDGRPYHTVRQADTPHWAFDRPFYILLNLAVGADDPGYPDATTPFPAHLVVDYVRVYR